MLLACQFTYKHTVTGSEKLTTIICYDRRVMEGIPKKKLVVREGTENDKFPVYDRVSIDDTREETPDELTPEEIAEFARAEQEFEDLPEELNVEQRKALQGVLAKLAQSNAAKYVRSGIAAIAIGGAFGSDRGETVSVDADMSSQNELRLDNQYATDLVSDEFQVEFSDRVRNPEKYMGEFDKRVASLVEKITDSDVDNTMKFAQKAVVGAEEFTRADYVAQEIKFTEWDPEAGTGVPPELEEELRKFLPALCFVESRFDADRESSVKAKGIFQIMPEIWKAYGGVEGEEKSLKAQVEVVGKLLSNMYKQLHDRLGSEVIQELKNHFPSERAFQKDFMLLALLNSYNAGDGTVAEAIARYLEDTDPADRPAGKDLYAAISDYAHLKDDGYLKYYKDHSRNYPYQIMAAAEKLNKNRG